MSGNENEQDVVSLEQGEDLLHSYEEEMLSTIYESFKFDELPGDVRDAVCASLQKDSTGASLTNLLLKYPEHETFINGVISNLYHISVLKNRIDAVKVKLRPFKFVEVERFVKNIAASLDYDSIVISLSQNALSGSFFSNTLYDLSFLRRSANGFIQGDYGELDYDKLSHIHETIMSYVDEWQKRKWFLDKDDKDTETAIPNDEEVRIQRAELSSGLKTIIKDVDEYMRLSRIYKPSLTFNIEALGDFPLRKFCEFVESEVDIDPAMLKAITRHTDAVSRNLLQRGIIRPRSEEERSLFYEYQNQIRTPEGVVLSVEGEVPEGYRQLVNNVMLNDEIRKLPESLLSRVLSIKTEQTSVEGIAGRHFPKFDEKGNYIGSEIIVYRSNAVTPEESEISRLIRIGDFLETVYHEISHSAHYGASLEELADWDRIEDEDSTSVSKYVKYERQKDMESSRRESFAESFRLFLGNPALLLVLSPSRFRYMSRFLESRFADENEAKLFQEKIAEKVVDAFMFWENMGITKKQLRRTV